MTAPHSMKRLLTIAGSMGVGLVAVVVACGLVFGGKATSAGKSAYQIRRWVERPRVRLHPERPLVAWLGDSTTVGRRRSPPYPQMIEQELTSSLPIETFNYSQVGLNAYLYYMMLGPVLDQEPEAIFMLANPRLMLPEGAGRRILQMASMIPRAELPRALTLPWHARSVTIPRLLLARTISWPGVEQGLYFVEGVRTRFRDALKQTPPKRSEEDAVALINSALLAYDRPILENSPTVRMLGATVAMSVRHGVPTTVVITPMPIAVLRERGLYGPRFLERVAVLKRVVEAAGGHVVDLHAAVPPEEFVDKAGHYSPAGVSRMTKILAPIVRAQVERSAQSDVAERNENRE